jgi:DNA-directed RNA polymerase II subunit RPB1
MTTTKVCSEDDITIKLRQIVKYNNILAKDSNPVYLTNAVTAQSSRDLYQVKQKYLDLQRSVACYQDSKYANSGSDAREYGAQRKSIRTRFTAERAKLGRVRNTILGKRMDYSARSVITPDSFIQVDEVGVPLSVCMKLTYPEKVNQYNIHRLVACLRNGPNVYPGANYVTKHDGSDISLEYVDPNMIQLEFGWIVKRHLVMGDLVLFNRQPSLHKMSVMVHKTRPIQGKSFRLHVACTGPYNADYDGDEMNLSVLLDDLTRSEGREIMAVGKNMVKDSCPLVCFQQHAVLGAYLLTADDVVLDAAMAQQILYQNPYLDTSTISLIGPVTGKRVIELCLPSDFCCTHGDLLVDRGVYVRGRLTKSSLNKGLLYTIWKDFGSQCALDFIGGVQIMLEFYLSVKGLSIGPGDCNISFSDEIQQLITDSEKYVDQFNSHGPLDIGKFSQAVETSVCLVMDKCRDTIGDWAVKQLSNRPNGFCDMIQSGAKGNLINITQTSGIVGQQRDQNCSRLPVHTSGFRSNQHRSKAHGYITSSFMKGLSAQEYFSHLVGSRVGLVDTAVKTSETGYCQRKISKALEDVTVHSDKVVRDAKGNILQFMYGKDGFDSTGLEVVSIRCTRMEDAEIVLYYGCAVALLQPEVESILLLKHQLQDQKNQRFLCPVNFERLLNRATSRVGGSDVVFGQVQSLVQSTWKKIDHDPGIHKTLKLKCVYFDWLSTAELCIHRKLTYECIVWLLQQVEQILQSHSITAHESVGLVASQNCSEPLTQMTLNRFHQSGQFSHLVTGVTRMKEIINVVKSPTAPSMTLKCLPGVNPEQMGCSLVYKQLRDLVAHWSSDNPDPLRVDLFRRFWSGVLWPDSDVRFVTFHLDREKTSQYGMTPQSLASSLRKIPHVWDNCTHDKNVYLAYSETSKANWWVALGCSVSDGLWVETANTLKKKSTVVVSDQLVSYALYEQLLEHGVHGVNGIQDFFYDSATQTIITKGSNLPEVLALEGLDHNETNTSCLTEIVAVFGIDAARRWIEIEMGSVMSSNNTNVSVRHIQLLASSICYRGYITPMTYQGICPPGTSVMKKAAFEKAMESFLLGAQQGQLDTGDSVTEAITWNSRLRCGTGPVELIVPPTVSRYTRGAWFGTRSVPYQVSDTDALFHPSRLFKDATVQTIVSSTASSLPSHTFFTETDTDEFTPTSPVCSMVTYFVSSAEDNFVPYSPS